MFSIEYYNRYNQRIVVNENLANGVPITGAISDIVTANLPSNLVLVSSSAGKVVTSSGLASKIANINDTTGPIQASIDSKEPLLTKGDLTEVTSSVLTISGGTGAVIGSGLTIQVKQATGLQAGYLSSSDWNTFNSKLSNSLSDGSIWIGDGGGLAQPRTMSGDATISNLGVLSIANSAITNAKVAAAAGIAFSKMAALTPSRAAVTDSSGTVTTSLVTDAELALLSGLTGASLQTQLGTKLTVSLTSPAQGDLIYYNGSSWVNFPRGSTNQILSSTGSSIQWINSSSNIPAGGATGAVLMKNSATDYDTVWTVLTVSNLSDITASAAQINALTTGYYDATSSIQTQFAGKLDKTLALNNMFVGNSSGQATTLAPGTDGYVLTSVSGAPTWVSPPYSYGHAIKNSGTPLTQRSNLNFYNGLTASDNDPDTDVVLGGTLTQATTIAHGGYNLSFTGTGKVVFSNSATLAGINVGSNSANPSSPSDGDLYYNSSANELRARINSAWVSLGSGGGGHVIENAGTPLTARANLNFYNGLTASDNNPDTDVKLGGTLTNDTLIDGTGYNIQIKYDDGVLSTGSIYLTNFGGIIAAVNDYTYTTDWTIDASLGFTINSTLPGFGGVKYNSDYSSNFTTRSLIDKGYADATYTVSSAVWLLASGGTLTGNNTISGAYTVTFSNKGLIQTQTAQSSSWSNAILSTPGAHTALTANTEFISRDFAGATQTWLDGTVTNQRFNYFRGYQVNKTTTSATFTNIYTVFVEQPTSGAGVTMTNSFAAGFYGRVALIAENGTGQITQLYQNSVSTRLKLTSAGFFNIQDTNSNTLFSESSTGNLVLTQRAQSSSWGPALTVTPGAHTAMTAATEFVSNDFAGATQTWADGTVATQRFNYFRGFTVNKTTTSATFTNIYTLYAEEPTAGSGVTFTSKWAAGFSGSVIMTGQEHFIKGSVSSSVLRLDNTASNTGVINFYTTGSQRGRMLWTNARALYFDTFANYGFGGNAAGVALVRAVQGALSSGWVPAIKIEPGAHTAMTAATEFVSNDFTGATQTWLDGTVAKQRFNYFRGYTANKTITSVTFTDIYTVYIDSSTAGAGVTFTNNWALGTAGAVKFWKSDGTTAGFQMDGSNNFSFYDTNGTERWTMIGASSGQGRMYANGDSANYFGPSDVNGAHTSTTANTFGFVFLTKGLIAAGGSGGLFNIRGNNSAFSTSATGTHRILSLSPANTIKYRNTGAQTATYIGVDLTPSIEMTNGTITVIGFNYEPSDTASVGYTHYSFRATAGTMLLPASVAGYAPLRIPHGTAPSSPTNGDIWTTTSSIYARINGSTIDLAAGGGGSGWLLASGGTLTGANTIDGADTYNLAFSGIPSLSIEVPYTGIYAMEWADGVTPEYSNLMYFGADQGDGPGYILYGFKTSTSGQSAISVSGDIVSMYSVRGSDSASLSISGSILYASLTNGYIQVTDGGKQFQIVPGTGQFLQVKPSGGGVLFSIEASGGVSGSVTGENIQIAGGNGYGTGNNDGGHVFLKPGTKHGTGKDGNIGIGIGSGSMGSWQSMERGMFIANALAAPSGNPSSGIFEWIDGSADSTRSYRKPSGDTGVYVGGDGLRKITVGTSAPSSPTTGDLWVDTN